MKVHELFESRENPKALAALEELAKELMNAVEDAVDEADFELEHKATGNRVSITTMDKPFPKIHLSYDITDFVVRNEIEPEVSVGINVTTSNKKEDKDSNAKVLAAVAKLLKDKKMWHGEAKFGTPWYHDDSNAYTKSGLVLMKLERRPDARSTSGSSPQYNPRAEFNARPGEMARQRRVSGHQFAGSIGGDSSNYR
jgi:hypothetical protein